MATARELKCSACKCYVRQKEEEKGGFPPMKTCPKCGAENTMGTLKTYFVQGDNLDERRR